MEGTIVLSTKGITKKYGSFVALNEVSFDLLEGEIVAFIGPNGAGKTTLFNILVGLTKDFEGEIYYVGKKLSNSLPMDYKRAIGFVPQHTNLERDLTVFENLLVHAYLYGISRKEAEKRIFSFLDLLGLRDLKDKEVGVLSGGTKRKIALIRAMLHDPKILLLDEPTTGLDVNSRREIWDFIVSMNLNRAVTVLLSTHYMDEAESLAKRVFLMDKGRVVVQGTPSSLKSALGRYTVELHTPLGIRRSFFSTREEAIEFVRKNEGIFYKIRDVNLEDVFIHLTGGNDEWTDRSLL